MRRALSTCWAHTIAFRYADEDKIATSFKTGDGMGWHEREHRLFEGTERFFRPDYKGHLVPEWIPALKGVEEKLTEGAKVADIGCGHGASTILMAAAFPASEFHSFEVATAKDYLGTGYDLIAVFDCLHSMGDPVGASTHIHDTLAPYGTWLIVEPSPATASRTTSTRSAASSTAPRR